MWKVLDFFPFWSMKRHGAKITSVDKGENGGDWAQTRVAT